MVPYEQVGEVIRKIPDEGFAAFVNHAKDQYTEEDKNDVVIKALVSDPRMHAVQGEENNAALVHLEQFHKLVSLLPAEQAKDVFGGMEARAFALYVSAKWEEHESDFVQVLAQDPKAHTHENILNMLEFLGGEVTTAVLRTMNQGPFQALVAEVNENYTGDLGDDQEKVVHALAGDPQQLGEIVRENGGYADFVSLVFAQMNERQQATFLQVLLNACGDDENDAKQRLEAMVEELIQTIVTADFAEKFIPQDLDQSFQIPENNEQLVIQIVRMPGTLAQHFATLIQPQNMLSFMPLIALCYEKMGDSESKSLFMQTLGVELASKNAQAMGQVFAQFGEDNLMYEAMAYAPVAFAHADAQNRNGQFKMYEGVRPFMTVENHAAYLEQLTQLNQQVLLKARVTMELQDLGNLDQEKLNNTGLVGYFVKHPDQFRDWVVDNKEAYIDKLIKQRHKVALALLERMGVTAETLITDLDKGFGIMGHPRFKNMLKILLVEVDTELSQERTILMACFQYASQFKKAIKNYSDPLPASNHPSWSILGTKVKDLEDKVYQEE